MRRKTKETGKKKKITIRCHINEPHQASFKVTIEKKAEISQLKTTICEELKKNENYIGLEPNSFFLMKKYCLIQEFVTVGDTISDRDNIYIILKNSIDRIII